MPKTKTLYVRITEDEYERLAKAARKSYEGNVSMLARKIVREWLSRQPK